MATLLETLMGLTGARLFHAMTRGKSGADLAAGLEAAGRDLTKQIANAAHTDRNHRVITHIIGIERWSQSRVKVALGEPFKPDEYDGYRPPKDTAWDALLPMFEATRQETINLAKNASPSVLETLVKHNTYRDLKVRGWLQYMQVHANFESRKLK
jgi:hypothetical protein